MISSLTKVMMHSMKIIDMEQPDIFTVSRLNSEVRFLLEDTFPFVWVEGEVTGFLAHTSGHWYFSLKDAAAQVKCAMFRASQRKLNFAPKNGIHVLVKARVSLYENRGDFQLICEFIEERGEGKLRQAYEALKKKLEAAGLFDPDRKKTFPGFPHTIGVITSPTGAAIRDILVVLKRRCPCANVIIYPAQVQGNAAAPTIVNAIETANRRNECDVLILARGGGSLEDLWPFNEEIVAHAVYRSVLPIISGIGHEVDFTIADYVADQRAPTPSAAAEIITPDTVDLLTLLQRQAQQAGRSLLQKISLLSQKLGWTEKLLSQQHPKRKLMEKMQQLDSFHTSLMHLIKTQLTKQQHDLASAAAKLEALSPLATLSRGYAIATNQQNQILRRVSQVKQGDEIKLKLYQGSLNCTIDKIN